MLGALAHRGPDGEGVWNEADVWIGHRRLSILDLSPAGRQPMVSADGRWVITLNGEIYNHRAMRGEVDAKDSIAWRGHSDTEVLLESIARVGIDAVLCRARGMFALAVWDRRDQTLHLARDRFGEKPLYYAADSEGLVFASELTSLRVGGIPNELDPEALEAYFCLGYVPAPLSILRRARKLPPASRLAWRRGAEPEIHAYWDLASLVVGGREDPFTDPGAATDALAGAVRDSIGEQMLADVPVGVFLSGGLDSSLVTAVMQSLASEPVRSFTIGFQSRAFDEAGEAAAVARYLGTDHTEHYVTDAAAREIVPSLGNLYDEPFADSSQIPTLLISRLARESVKVCLTGDGADEMFGGYVRYTGAPRLWRALRPWPRPLRRAAGAALSRLPLNVAAGCLRGLAPLANQYTSRGALGSDLRRVAGWLGARSQADLYQLTMTAWPDPAALLSEPCRAGAPRLRPAPPTDLLGQMQWRDTLDYLPGDILCKVDRGSMAHGLETRAPYLDARLAAVAWRTPTDMKLRDGQSKWLMRQVLARYLPPSLIERPKKGFSPPLHAWLIGPLREWAEGLIGAEALRRGGVLDPRVVAPVWARYLAGDASGNHRIWSVLMFQAWLAAGRAGVVA